MKDLRVVHRDLKPENIFVHVDENGQEVIKIADFGFATVESINEVKGALLGQGTPAYLAPETVGSKFRSSNAYPTNIGDHIFGVDMWSAGVILYIMWTKFHPFYGNRNDPPHLERSQNYISYDRDRGSSD